MAGYFLAALIGLSLGVLGGGGSILTVPIFVYAMGYAPKEAIAMSLPVVGVTSLVGAIGHWRAARIDGESTLVFGGFAMLGAYGGARLSALLSGFAQLVLLALVMLAAATLMLRTPRAHDETRGPPHRLLAAAAGCGVGIVTGLVGIGGGFMFVPALVLLARVPMKRAIGTSLVVIAMNTAAASLGYTGQVAIPWNVVAVFTAIAVGGILVGTRVVHRVPTAMLRRGFSYFLFVMAAFILYENRHVLGNPGSALRARTPAAAPR